MTWQYLIKGLYAGAVAFLGGLLTAMQVAPDIGFADISNAAWVTIVLATLLAVGGVLRLQAAPPTISTSIK